MSRSGIEPRTFPSRCAPPLTAAAIFAYPSTECHILTFGIVAPFDVQTGDSSFAIKLRTKWVTGRAFKQVLTCIPILNWADGRAKKKIGPNIYASSLPFNTSIEWKEDTIPDMSILYRKHPPRSGNNGHFITAFLVRRQLGKVIYIRKCVHISLLSIHRAYQW